MGRIERRKRETWLQFLWALSDVGAILLAFPVAYWLRFQSPLTAIVPVTKGVPPIDAYMTAGVVMCLAWLPLFRAMGLYDISLVGPRVRSIFRLGWTVAVAVVIGAALTFFYRGFSFSRAFFPLLFLALFVLMFLGRRLTRVVTRRWRRRSPIRLLLVGRSPSGVVLATRLRDVDPTGVEVVGSLTSEVDVDDAGLAGSPPTGAVPAIASATDPDPFPVIGSWREVEEIVTGRRVDVLVLALPLQDQHVAAEVVSRCRGLPVDVEMVPDTLQLMSRRARVREIDGLPVFSLREFPLTGWNGVTKRTFDLVATSIGVVLLSPVYLALALAVKLTSPGPVFYAQERLGRDGRRFRILKFRSMRVDAESRSGPVWAGDQDPRRTPIGAFLREWSLDELPQLFNVLRGAMSLVGPRPERPHFVTRFSDDMPHYVDRHRVKSGVTGWAQVNGLRGDTSIEERTTYDLYYVENWSLIFDVKILWLTVRAVLGRENAY